MTPRRGFITLVGSLALHAAAITGALALVAGLRQPEPLFVDLTGGDLTGGDLTGGAPAGDERVAAPPRGRETAVSPARETPRVSARAVPASATPAPAQPAETPPAPAASSSASREAAAPDLDAAVPFAITDGGGAREVASDAPAPTGQPSGAVAGAGALLALAGPGTGRGEVPPEFGPYLARFRQRIQELIVYPLAARRRGLAGRVEVELLLEPSGRVRDIAVVASSSHALLDAAAVEAVRALQPLPLPEHLPRRALRVRLPVIFQLR